MKKYKCFESTLNKTNEEKVKNNFERVSVYMQYYKQGMTRKEIAEEVEVSPPTISILVKRNKLPYNKDTNYLHRNNSCKKKKEAEPKLRPEFNEIAKERVEEIDKKTTVEVEKTSVRDLYRKHVLKNEKNGIKN